MTRRLQPSQRTAGPSRRPAKAQLGPLYTCDRCGQPLSPYLTAEQGAAFIGAPTRAAFHEWARRVQLPVIHRGRRALYLRSDVERVMRTLTHGRTA